VSADVTLRFPAQPAYVVLARTAVAALAARADRTLDEIEDLRLAVGEACALLLSMARPDAELECVFTVDAPGAAGALSMRLSVDAEPGAAEPAADDFAWLVLRELAGAVAVRRDGDRVALALGAQRETV
jgi:serine/threonine-protein kinase RsbW